MLGLKKMGGDTYLLRHTENILLLVEIIYKLYSVYKFARNMVFIYYQDLDTW